MKKVLLILYAFFILHNLQAKGGKPDTIDLRRGNMDAYFRLKRDVEITMQDLVKFRCKLLYADSVRCIVEYHTGVKPKNIVNGPQIKQHQDSSLGKHIFIIPMAEVKVIRIWTTRSSMLAELPFGLCSYGTGILGIVAVGGLAPTPAMLGLIAGSAAVATAGYFLQKPKKYVVIDGALIRWRYRKR